MIDARHLGQAIRIQRRRANVSQRELAEEIGTQQSYISEIETGKRLMSLATLGRLADALGIRPSELLRAAERRGGES
jgi:transcriptional regulator with XRE-family HTH domain